MSNLDFVKGQCPLCDGHLEFPAEASGQTIPCPHCGQIIDLGANRTTSKGSRRQRVAIGVALTACLTGAFLALFSRHSPTSASSVVPTISTNISTNPVKTVQTTLTPTLTAVTPAHPGELETNHFGISGGTLQNTSGSSLVYVLGVVRNLDDHQRFGVKINYSLFDAAGQLVGQATDYQSEIDPQGEWDFKALVMSSKAVSAHFSDITEQ